MQRSTGRLSAAPDGYSDVVLADKTIGTAPQYPGCVNNRYGAGPTPRPLRSRGADMAQSTRGFPGSDSETRISAVKITPASSVSATVPTIQPVA
jgi:hypothetical protein